MKQLQQLWKELKGLFYLYNWLKPIVCKYFKHKRRGKLFIYEQEKKKNKNGVMMSKHRYDPYLVYTCARCHKSLGSVRLRRKLKKDEMIEYVRQVKEIERKKTEQQLKFKEGK